MVGSIAFRSRHCSVTVASNHPQTRVPDVPRSSKPDGRRQSVGRIVVGGMQPLLRRKLQSIVTSFGIKESDTVTHCISNKIAKREPDIIAFTGTNCVPNCITYQDFACITCSDRMLCLTAELQ
jgi:hypothetical protein